MSELGPSSCALELAAALRRRELSAVELLDACLAAVDERNPELNAVIWRNDEQARAAAAEADRRLAAGDGRRSWACRCRSRTSRRSPAGPSPTARTARPRDPSEESELVVDALVRAGFVLCGRTNTPEFGVITAAENRRYGITPQPLGHEPLAGRLERRRRGRGRRRACSRSLTPTTAAARSASRRPTAAWSASSRAAAAFRASRRAGSARSSRAWSRGRSPTRRPCSTRSPAPTRWPGTTRRRRRGRSPSEPRAPPGPLRIGLMAQAPLGHPHRPRLHAAARARPRAAGGARPRRRGGRGADDLRRDGAAVHRADPGRPRRLRGRGLVEGRAAHRPPAQRGRRDGRLRLRRSPPARWSC